MTDLNRVGQGSGPISSDYGRSLTDPRQPSEFGSVVTSNQHVGGQQNVAAPLVGQQGDGQPAQRQQSIDPTLTNRRVATAQLPGGGGVGVALAAGHAGGVAATGASSGGILARLSTAIRGFASDMGRKIADFCTGGHLDKAHRNIDALLQRNQISPQEARQLRNLDDGTLRDLVRVSKSETGITEKTDRDAIRRAVLFTAARDVGAAKALKAELIGLHPPKESLEDESYVRAAADAVVAAPEADLNPPGMDARAAAVQNDAELLTAYRNTVRRGIAQFAGRTGRPPTPSELGNIKGDALDRATQVNDATPQTVFDSQNHPWLASKFEGWVRNVNASGDHLDTIDAVDRILAKSGDELRRAAGEFCEGAKHMGLWQLNSVQRGLNSGNLNDSQIKDRLGRVKEELRGFFDAEMVTKFQVWAKQQPDLH